MGDDMKEFFNADLGLSFEYPDELKLSLQEGRPSDGYLCCLSLVGEHGTIDIKVSMTQSNVQLDHQASPIFEQTATRIQIQQGTPTKRGDSGLVSITKQRIPCQTTQIHTGDQTFHIYLTSIHQMCYHCVLSRPRNDWSLNETWKEILDTMKFFTPQNTASIVPSVVWSYYVGSNRPFFMLYPCDWVVTEREPLLESQNNETETVSSATRAVDFFYGGNDVNINVMLVEEPVPEDITFRDYYDMCKLHFQKSGIPLFTVASQNVELANLPAKQFNYSPKPGTDIFRRLTLKDNKALVISCESKNNQSLKIGPVFEHMMNSFSFLEEQHKEKALLYCFEHFENKICFEFPKFLEYTQDDCMIKLFDPEHPLNCFEIKCYKETDQQQFPDLLTVQQAIITATDPSVQIKLISSEQIIISGIEGLEFTCTGTFVGEVLCKKTTRLVKREQKLFCWEFLCEAESFVGWGMTLVSSINFL